MSNANEKNVNEIRKLHAIMESKEQIRYCKSILNSSVVSEQDKEYARAEISRMESEIKRLESA